MAGHNTGYYADLARAQNAKLLLAQETGRKADDARRESEEQAAQKAVEFRRQLEEQNLHQIAEAKQKISEQARRDLDEARRQVAEQAKRELDEGRHQVELAKEQAEAAHQQVEDTKRQAMADARFQVEQASGCCYSGAVILRRLLSASDIQRGRRQWMEVRGWRPLIERCGGAPRATASTIELRPCSANELRR